MTPALPVLLALLISTAPDVPLASSLPDTLFVSETAVADEGSETRNQALVTLLERVLVRVSGDPGIVARPAARELVATAPSLVQNYRYVATGSADGSERLLRAQFDPVVVQRRMRELGLPVWTRRPRVLMWLARERDGQRELLNLELSPAARDAVSRRARELGLPLQLPLMDLEDQSRITPADLWSGYRQGIALASSRYPHDAVLTGRVTERRDGARIDWTLIDDPDETGFQTDGDGLGTSLVAGIDQVLRVLAARHAPAPSSAAVAGTRVAIRGIADIAAYGRVIDALGGFEPSVSRNLRAAVGDSLVFELTPPVADDVLRATLNASGALVAEPPPIGPGLPSAGAGDAPPTGSAGVPLADYHYRLSE